MILIDGKVGEVRVLGPLAERHIVGLRGEANQPLVVDVDAPGVHRRDAHVEAQIEFKSVYQKWVGHIATNDAVFVDWHL